MFPCEIFGDEGGIGHENKIALFRNYPNLARQRGASTIELTVVITRFLILVGILFIDFTAWKIEANQAACVTNLSSIEHAVDACEN
jgi:hypothetical protein